MIRSYKLKEEVEEVIELLQLPDHDNSEHQKVRVEGVRGDQQEESVDRDQPVAVVKGELPPEVREDRSR